MTLYYKDKGDDITTTETYVEADKVINQRDVILYSVNDENKIIFKDEIIWASVFVGGLERVLK